jgi:hypothetical protein
MSYAVVRCGMVWSGGVWSGRVRSAKVGLGVLWYDLVGWARVLF